MKQGMVSKKKTLLLSFVEARDLLMFTVQKKRMTPGGDFRDTVE